jgi:hypothetical protein
MLHTENIVSLFGMQAEIRWFVYSEVRLMLYVKEGTQGAGAHSPSVRKKTDEIFLMIVLFYGAVKGNEGNWRERHVRLI